MAYLTRHQYPALIAGTIQGTTGGTRALCQGRRSYCTTHLFTGAQGQKFLAAVAVGRVFTTARRTKRLKRRAEWVLFILIRLALSPRFARQLYRGRFGIETSGCGSHSERVVMQQCGRPCATGVTSAASLAPSGH